MVISAPRPAETRPVDPGTSLGDRAAGPGLDRGQAGLAALRRDEAGDGQRVAPLRSLGGPAQVGIPVESARQREARGGDAGQCERQGTEADLEVEGLAGAPGDADTTAAGGHHQVVDDGRSAVECHAGGVCQGQPIPSTRGGEPGELDPGTLSRHEACGAVEVEAPRLGRERDVAGVRRTDGGEAYRIEAFPRRDEAIRVHTSVDHRSAAQVAPGEVGIEAVQAEFTGAQRRALRPDRGVLPAAIAGQGDGSVHAAAQGRQGKRGEVVEVAGRQGKRSLRQEGAGVDGRAAVEGDGAEPEGQPVEGPRITRAPGEVRVAAQGLPADITGQADGAIEGAGEVRKGGVQAQIAQGPSEGAGRVRRQRGGEVRLLQGAAEASVEERAAGELRVEGREILDVDDQLGVRHPRRGAALQASHDLRALEACAVECVAVIDL